MPRAFAHFLAFFSAWTACAAMAVAPVPARAQDDDASVEELRTSLARDQARLIALLGAPREGDAYPANPDPELRAIAERMPRTQAALRARQAETTPGIGAE
jgi:hypothetical protein